MLYAFHTRVAWLWMGRLVRIGSAITLVTLGAVVATPAEAEDRQTDLIVHEWGTFLGMSGSDGASLDGMYMRSMPCRRSCTAAAATSSGCRSRCSRARRR